MERAEEEEPRSLPPHQLKPLLNPWIRGYFAPSESWKHVSFPFTDLIGGCGGDEAIMKLRGPYATRPPECDAFDIGTEDEKTVISMVGPPFHTVDTGNVLLQGSSEFCSACYSALSYLTGRLQEKRSHEERKSYWQADDGEISVVHHWNVVALIKAASSGCPLCLTLWLRCYRKLDTRYWPRPIDLLWTSEEGCVWKDGRSGCPRLISAMNSLFEDPRKGHTYYNLFRFQLWLSPDCDRFFQHVTITENTDDKLKSSGPLCDPTSQSSSTQACKSTALKWLSDCKRNIDGRHDACNASNGKRWYPTRLLDLSDVQKSGIAKIVLTDVLNDKSSDHGDYITLSHRWGTWGAENMQRLTETNLGSWMKDGVSFASILPTFADAIQIAQWFNTRWLWIDSMCIIQDSVDDWNNEAAMMCEIYRHAILNISADGSRDSRGGCFKHRPNVIIEPFKMYMPRLDAVWWVTVDERSLFDWVEGSPISKRAWTYQERHLSRRILYFTEHEVFWECCATEPAFKCETYPTGPPYNRGFVNQTKLSLTSSVIKNIDEDQQLDEVWSKVCKEYSARRLSYPQDKLPALAGLAREIGSKRPKDVYIAGMWSSTLTRDLLWKTRTRCVMFEPRPTTYYIAPSWSWLSVGHPVVMLDAYNYHSIIDVLDIDYHPSTESGYGRIRRASLTLQAFIRPIMVRSKPWIYRCDESGSSMFDYFQGDVQEDDLFVDELDNEIEDRIGWHMYMVSNFDESPDSGDKSVATRRYHCLLLAVTQRYNKSMRDLHGLLVELVAQPNVYKRVGTISFHSDCALKMRYRERQQLSLRQRQRRERQPSDDKNNADAIDRTNKDTWKRLSQRVRPIWGHQGPLGKNESVLTTNDVSISGTGPMSLYEFDDAPAAAAAAAADNNDDDDEVTKTTMMDFEKLTPTVVKLI